MKINEKRIENGLQPLDLYTIGLAQDSHPDRTIDEEEKLSSSNQRMRLLGTVLKEPVVRLAYIKFFGLEVYAEGIGLSI